MSIRKLWKNRFFECVQLRRTHSKNELLLSSWEVLSHACKLILRLRIPDYIIQLVYPVYLIHGMRGYPVSRLCAKIVFHEDKNITGRGS